MLAQLSDERFAKEKMLKLMLSLALPAIAAQVVNALYNLVDRMFIGRIPEIGSTALTGVGLAFPIIMLISAFAALIGYGGAPLFSIKMGEGKKEEAQQMAGSCLVMLLGVGILLTALLFIFKTPLLTLFGASEQTLPYADKYLSIYLVGTVCVQTALGMNQFLSAQGMAKTAMLTVFMGAGMNIVLDYLFISQMGMGVEGAAIATVISQTVSAIWVLCVLFSKKTSVRIEKKHLRFRLDIAKHVLPLGLSPFIMQSTESLLQIAFNKSLSHYGGDTYVGAVVIMTSIMQFMTMPLMGFAQGAQPIIGYNYGARKFDRVRSAIRYCTFFCVTFSLIFWAVACFSPRTLAAIFDAPELIDLTCQMMPMFFAGMCVFGFQMSFQQIFIALGQAKASIFIASLRKLILLIPLILVLPHIIEPATTGVFMAEPIADIIAALTCCGLFAYKYRKMLVEPAQEKSD